MYASKQAFGQVLHADLLVAKPSFVVPGALDASLLHPAAATKFLSDKIKVALGLPLTHRPRMAIVDDVLFKEYLTRLVESATKLDELMAEYEELENSTPGVNRDRLHATVQQSVQLISHVKGGTVHLTLEGLARWLKKQAFELERTHSELDTFEEAGICVAQVDDEMDQQDASSPEVQLKKGNAPSYGGGAGKQRNVPAMRRTQTAVQGGAATPKAASAKAVATKVFADPSQVSTCPVASPPSATINMALDVSVVPVTDATEATVTTASPILVPTGMIAPKAPALGDAGLGVSEAGSMSSRGKKQPQEIAVSSFSKPTSEVGTAEVKELRGTVSKQSQQLEQLNAKLKQAELKATNACARMAEIEAQMAKQGIELPPAIMAAVDDSAATPGFALSQAKAHKGLYRQGAVSETGVTVEDDGGVDSKDSDDEQPHSANLQAGMKEGGQAAKVQPKGPAGAKGQVKMPGSGKSRQGKPGVVSGVPVGSKASRSKAKTTGPVLGSKGNSDTGGLPEVHTAMDVAQHDVGSNDNSAEEGEAGDSFEDQSGGRVQGEEQNGGGKCGAGMADRATGSRKAATSELIRQVSELQRAILERENLIASMQQDMDEMSQALGVAIATVELPAPEGANVHPKRSHTQGTVPEGSPMPQPAFNGGRSNSAVKVVQLRGPSARPPLTLIQTASVQEGLANDLVTDVKEGVAEDLVTHLKEHNQGGTLEVGWGLQDGTLAAANSTASDRWAEQTCDGASANMAVDCDTAACGEETGMDIGCAPASGTAANTSAISNPTHSRIRSGGSLARLPARVRSMRTRIPESVATQGPPDAWVDGGSPNRDSSGCDATQRILSKHRRSCVAGSLSSLAKQELHTHVASLPFAKHSCSICPRCAELEKQLRYWRERSWFKKARNTRWALLRKTREMIPVSSSQFKGVLKTSDQVESVGSLLASRRIGISRRALSAGLSMVASNRTVSRGRSFAGGAQDLPEVVKYAGTGSLSTQQILGDPQAQSGLNTGRSGSGQAASYSRGDQATRGAGGPLTLQDQSDSISRSSSSGVADPNCVPGITPGPFRNATRLTRSLTSTALASRTSSPQDQCPWANGSNTADVGQRLRSQALIGSVGAGGTTTEIADGIGSRVGSAGQAASSVHASEKQATVGAHAALEHGRMETASNTSGISGTCCGNPCPDLSTDGKGTVSFAGSSRFARSGNGPETLSYAAPVNQSTIQPWLGRNPSRPGDSVSGNVRNEHSQVSDGQSDVAPPRGNAIMGSRTPPVPNGLPETMENGSDNRFEEQWDGMTRSRASAGSHGSRGRLRVGHVGPFRAPEKAEPPNGNPLAVGSGCSSSPEQRSAGHRLVKPAARAKVEQKVDLASLALQGKRATSEIPDPHLRRRAVDSHTHKMHPRLVSSAGHLGNQHPSQLKPGSQLRSFKLLGAGINHAKDGKEYPEANS